MKFHWISEELFGSESSCGTEEFRNSSVPVPRSGEPSSTDFISEMLDKIALDLTEEQKKHEYKMVIMVPIGNRVGRHSLTKYHRIILNQHTRQTKRDQTRPTYLLK